METQLGVNVGCFNKSNLSSIMALNGSLQKDVSHVIENTTGINQWSPSNGLKITLSIFYSLIFVCGVLGNGLVCFVLGVKSKNKNRYNILLISLATADFLASFFGPLIMIGDLAGNLNQWYFGAAMCKVLPAISPITLIASSWSLAMISYDRYRVVSTTRVSRQSLDPKIIAFQVSITWLIALFVSIPYVMGTHLKGKECINTSVFQKEHLVAYAACWMIIGWGIPLVFILFFSCVISRILRRDASCSLSSSITARRVERNRKVFKMFIVIFLAFFLLTGPYSIFYISGTYIMYMKPEKADENTLKQLNYALFVLMVANSCINPIIYAKMHKEIHRYTRKLYESICYMYHSLRHHIFPHDHHDQFVLSSIVAPDKDNDNDINTASPSFVVSANKEV